METDIEDLARRLVIGHKRDGRRMYDPAAKQELLALCRRPGASVAKLARECGVNANLVASWLRGRADKAADILDAGHSGNEAQAPFIPVRLQPVVAASPTAAPAPSIQARLPNGVVLDLQCDDLQQLGKLVESLGRMRCSASTKG